MEEFELAEFLFDGDEFVFLGSDGVEFLLEHRELSGLGTDLFFGEKDLELDVTGPEDEHTGAGRADPEGAFDGVAPPHFLEGFGFGQKI